MSPGILLLICNLLAASTAVKLDLQEGEECEALGGGKGTCRSLAQCPEAGNFKVDQPSICQFNQTDPIICCPKKEPVKQVFGIKIQKYCREQIGTPVCEPPTKEKVRVRRNATSPPAWVDERYYVHGGTAADGRTHRYMALIGFGSSLEDVDWNCGGSLIKQDFVLSAAHCASLPSRGPAKWARVGDLDISSNNEDAEPQTRKIIAIHLHPNYKEPVIYHDIVLFKIDPPVYFTGWVWPICLHTEPQIPHEIATVTGWGRTGFVELTSSKLLEADLIVYNDTECHRLMNQLDSKTPQGIDEKLMFCAGIPDGSKDACSGDSGGPLTVKLPGQCIAMQVGITSYGKQCGLPNTPGVYTRIFNYVDWIEQVAFEFYRA